MSLPAACGSHPVEIRPFSVGSGQDQRGEGVRGWMHVQIGLDRHPMGVACGERGEGSRLLAAQLPVAPDGAGESARKHTRSWSRVKRICNFQKFSPFIFPGNLASRSSKYLLHFLFFVALRHSLLIPNRFSARRHFSSGPDNSCEIDSVHARWTSKRIIAI